MSDVVIAAVISALATIATGGATIAAAYITSRSHARSIDARPQQRPTTQQDTFASPGISTDFDAPPSTRNISGKILQILLAILVPPLGVALHAGLSAHILINLLLTLLGYIPGIIHAVWVICSTAGGSRPGWLLWGAALLSVFTYIFVIIR